MNKMIEVTTKTTNVTFINDVPKENLQVDLPFELFVPTLAQCYFIVLSGYSLSKFKLLSASDVQGVSSFASYVAMPAIICASLGSADLSDLQWNLLVGITLGKLIIYILIASIAFVLTRGWNFAIPAIYAMFCIQCNDLPVGNPLISSLYRNSRPHMIKYLFFIPAITIVIFSPITFLIIECKKQQPLIEGTSTSDINLCIMQKLRHHIMKDIIQSPVVIATVLGLSLNLIFKSHVPPYLYHPIQVLAEMIPGLALSILGFNICGREHHLFKSGIVLAFALVTVKMIFTPLVSYFSIKCISTDINHLKDYLDFSLLYGVISPAAVIFQPAQKYQVSIESMAAALIISSLMCFPLSYIIAKLTIIHKWAFEDYIPNLQSAAFYASCSTLICCLYTCFAFICKRNYARKPRLCIFVLIFCQILIACCVIVLRISRSVLAYIACFFITFGEITMSLWIAILIIFLLSRKNNFSSLLGNKLALFALISLGFSAICTSCLVLFALKSDVVSLHLFGLSKTRIDRIQLYVTTMVTAISLIIGCTGIGKYYRNKNTYFSNYKGKHFNVCKKCNTLKTTVNSEQNNLHHTLVMNFSKCKCNHFCNEENYALYYQDLKQNEIHNKLFPLGSTYTARVLSFVSLMILILMIRLCSNILKLSNCDEISVMVPMEFLQNVLFFGQGIITLLTFGIDLRFISICVRKWLFHPCSEDRKLNNIENIKLFCQLFRKLYQYECFVHLAREREWKGQYYKDTFWGHQFVTWIVSKGIASNRTEAETYGKKLFHGNIICHITNKHFFCDAPYLYYFAK